MREPWLLASVDEAPAVGVGYPVMLKSTVGGGGMYLCGDVGALQAAFTSVQRTAGTRFGDARVCLEPFVEGARRVEVQVFGNGGRAVVALAERDCSLQRRKRKVLEETPAQGTD